MLFVGGDHVLNHHVCIVVLMVGIVYQRALLRPHAPTSS